MDCVCQLLADVNFICIGGGQPTRAGNRSTPHESKDLPIIRENMHNILPSHLEYFWESQVL